MESAYIFGNWSVLLDLKHGGTCISRISIASEGHVAVLVQFLSFSTCLEERWSWMSFISHSGKVRTVNRPMITIWYKGYNISEAGQRLTRQRWWESILTFVSVVVPVVLGFTQRRLSSFVKLTAENTVFYLKINTCISIIQPVHQFKTMHNIKLKTIIFGKMFGALFAYPYRSFHFSHFHWSL